MQFGLLSNDPNPFNPQSAIAFALAAAQQAVPEIYDVQGRRVVQLANAWYPAAQHAVPWEGRNETATPVAAGVYWVRLRAGDRCSAQRMLLLR